MVESIVKKVRFKSEVRERERERERERRGVMIILSVTQMRSIEHTWLCAISHICHITGFDVKMVSYYRNGCVR